MLVRLHEKQAAFYRSRARFTLFCGGIGSGKTYSGAVRFLERLSKYPATRGYVLANTYAQLRQATLWELRRVAEDAGLDVEINWSAREINVGRRRLYFQSLERFDDLRGIEMGHFWLDEARDVRADAWKVLQGRLREKQGPLVGDLTSTPNGLNHWLYREFEASPRKDVLVVRAATQDNPHLPESYVADLERSYAGGWYEQEILGVFTNVASGRCYRHFERALHVGPVAFDPGQDLLVGVDFNVNPMTAVLAQNATEGLAVVAEYFAPDSDTFALRDWLEGHWERRLAPGRQILCYPDASGNARSATGTSNFAILQKSFAVRAPRANPSQVDRVNAVNALLLKGQLLVDPSCERLIGSLEQTVWKEGGRPEIDKRPGCEHITDALGYLVCTKHPLRRPTRVVMGRR